MSLIENLATIGITITKLFEFIKTNESISPDFQEYLATIGANQEISAHIDKVILTYLVERRLFDENKSIFELYLEAQPKLDELEKNIVLSLMKTMSSVFSIKQVQATGFLLNNLVDEMDYDVISLVKMSTFRGICASQFAIARIFPFENNYILLEISDVLPERKKRELERYAVSKLIENPAAYYENNEAHYKMLEAQVEDFSKKFYECFKTDTLVTLSNCTDEIISFFNDYCIGEATLDSFDSESLIKQPEKYEFCQIEEFNSTYNDFLEKASGGFSAHSKVYDVGIIYASELGLFVIPFYATFCEIFNAADYKAINGYKECVLHFLQNDKISYIIIEKIAVQYPSFIKVSNEILDSNLTLDELLTKYKSDYKKPKAFSSATVLYASRLFTEIMAELTEAEDENNEPDELATKAGRNDPCPCGSGKKYKKCCLEN